MSAKIKKYVYDNSDKCCGICGEGIDFKSEWKLLRPTSTSTTIDSLIPICQGCGKRVKQWGIERYRTELQQYPFDIKTSMYSRKWKEAVRWGLITENVIPIVFHFEKKTT